MSRPSVPPSGKPKTAGRGLRTSTSLIQKHKGRVEVNSLVSSVPFSPLTSAERRDIDLYVKDGAVMQGLRTHLGFSGAENGDKHLRQAVCDHGGSVCSPAL